MSSSSSSSPDTIYDLKGRCVLESDRTQTVVDRFLWCCDACGHTKYKQEEVERWPGVKRVQWACTSCKQVHIASNLYPPCWKCKKHKYQSSYNDRAIVCSYCHTFARDLSTGMWFYSLPPPLDKQTENANQKHK
jgi:hypothetical protein